MRIIEEYNFIKMGNTYCVGARDKLDEKQKQTMELYSRLS
jgi:hypothetical protein